MGDTHSERVTGTAEDEFGSYRYRYDFTGRDAVVAPGSRIGPMVFDDERGEYSESRFGRYRSSDRRRS